MGLLDQFVCVLMLRPGQEDTKNTHRMFYAYRRVDLAYNPDEQSSINSLYKRISNVPGAFHANRRVNKFSRGIC